jgi:hypothetical protein
VTLLITVIRAARQTGLTPPTSVMGSGEETWLQMVEWAQETIDDMALRHDWRALHGTSTITGDGTTTDFALPSDYSRLSKMPALSRDGSLSGFWPAGPVSDPTFINAQTTLTGYPYPPYKIEGGYVKFATAPAAAETYTLSYQSSKPIYSVGSGTPTNIAEWTYDSDAPRISERLLRLGLVWRWKAAKGLDYAEALSSYERTLESESSHDWGLAAISTSRDDIDREFGEPRVDA